jgi:hypothetical protein
LECRSRFFARIACTLGYDSASWSHLVSYIGLLERLPADLGRDQACAVQAGVANAVDQLRQVVQRFGSPALVRQLLRDEPSALSGEAAPEMPYAAMVWWIGGLQASAGLAASILQRLSTPAGDGGQHKEQLQLLGGVADKARRRIAPLFDALDSFTTPLLEANRGVSEACQRAGDLLQQTQEAVGGLHEQVGQVERQLAQLGLFGAHRKQDLLAQLHGLQKDRAEAMARASRFQVQLGALDALLDEGAWIEFALADAIDSLEKLRTAWTRFGSGMTQLAADTAPAQLADAAWAEQALELAEAIRQWTALERAARGFAAKSLVDFGEGPRP